jgi:hypothetical protein
MYMQYPFCSSTYQISQLRIRGPQLVKPPSVSSVVFSDTLGTVGRLENAQLQAVAQRHCKPEGSRT